MKKTRILVIDDEASIVKYLKANLELKGFEVLTALDGVEGLAVLEREMPDLVILDIIMPGIDGFEVCSRIREWSQIPIIMLSVRETESDKVRLLDLGADDYLTKPFGANELIARVNAVMRRVDQSASTVQPVYSRGELVVNFVKRKVTIAGSEIKLTPTEYNLLYELISNRGKTLTHTYLLNKIWGEEYADDTQYLHVFVRRLRSKMKSKSDDTEYILTVPWVGYQFVDEL